MRVVRNLFGVCSSDILSLAEKRNPFNYCTRADSSRIRLYLHSEVEEGINCQITKELTAAYAYFNIAVEFGRVTVNFPGFRRLFNRFATEELEHARRWSEYLNLRGGRAKFTAVPSLPLAIWTPLSATDLAIEMELDMTRNLHGLRSLADQRGDPRSVKLVEDEYLAEQYEGLKRLGDLRTQIARLSDGVGLHILDRSLLKDETTDKSLQ